MMTLVRFQTRTGDPLYVRTVRWAGGDGMRAKSVTFTRKRDEAASFQPSTADALAQQFFTKVVVTEAASTGAVVKDYCAEHRVKCEAYFAAQRDLAATLEAGLADVCKRYIDALAGVK